MQITSVHVDETAATENHAANEQMRATSSGVRMEEIPPAKVRAARASVAPSMRNWGDTPVVLSTPLSDWLASGAALSSRGGRAGRPVR